MARPQHDPPLNARIEVAATEFDATCWRTAARDVPLAAWARRALNEAAREHAYDEACPERLLVLAVCHGTDKTGAALMLTPEWPVAHGTRSLDLFLSKEQGERLIADLQAALADPRQADKQPPPRREFAEAVPGWSRWPGRPDRDALNLTVSREQAARVLAALERGE